MIFDELRDREEEYKLLESRINLNANQQSARFQSSSIEDFCEKVEAVCEPGNRSIYTSPAFSYLQARLTGKTRMLLAKKRGIFSLYFTCRSFRPAGAFDGFLRWLWHGRNEQETAQVLVKMISIFAEKIIKNQLAAGGYTEDQVFPDGFDEILKSSPQTDLGERLKQIHTISTAKPDHGRIIVAFDDAASLLNRKATMFVERREKRTAVKVNMLRWLRHCISSEVCGDTFWETPFVFCDSSPEIDKTEPIRRGESAVIGEESPRVFMPLILHDSFDLFVDRVAASTFEVNTRMAWQDHLRSDQYLIDLAFYGRAAWGSLTCALLEEKPVIEEAVVIFTRAVCFPISLICEERLDVLKILTSMDLSSPSYHFQAAVILVLASTFAVFDVHSTNLNLLYAKRCLCELLALDMDGRVCFSTFPSEPLVSCNYAYPIVGSEKLFSRLIHAAAEYHRNEIITLDSAQVFVIQLIAFYALQSTEVADNVRWQMVCLACDPLKTCLPRKAECFLEKILGKSLLSKLTNVQSLIKGTMAASHFATLDMDDVVEELGQRGFMPVNTKSAINCLDTVQLALSVGRLIGRNAIGVVAEPWRGIDMIVPVACVNGQLGCVLACTAGKTVDGVEKEDLLDQTLLDLINVDPTMLLAAPNPPPKLALPALGIVFKDLDSLDHTVSFKQLGDAVRVTVTGVPPWLAASLSSSIIDIASLWKSLD